MIFFSSLFVAANAPHYFKGTIDMLIKADKCIFAYDNDLKVFVNMLKNRLKADAPLKSKAHIDLHISHGTKSGMIYIHGKAMTENSVARLSFDYVNGVLEYDPEAGDMFDISDRFVDLLTEGGAL